MDNNVTDRHRVIKGKMRLLAESDNLQHNFIVIK